ncbi:MAG: hypothetical protein HZA50_04525 [Planctomycetes bacterium]|nr:hypothetical protein [Planctomycetota bacterium]
MFEIETESWSEKISLPRGRPREMTEFEKFQKPFLGQSTTNALFSNEELYRDSIDDVLAGDALVLKPKQNQEAEANRIILYFNSMAQSQHKLFLSGRLEWLMDEVQPTDFRLMPPCNKLDEKTVQFVKNHDLSYSVSWLQTATPVFFNGAGFEIDMLPEENEDESLLAIRVFSNFNATEFRDRRHRFCESMLQAGHTRLHELSCIFQRRLDESGWKAFSWYSTLSSV